MSTHIIFEIRSAFQAFLQTDTISHETVIASIGMWIFHVIKETVFRPHQQVGDTVFIEVHNSRAGCVAGKDTFCDHSLIAENMAVIVRRNISKKINVSAVHHNVQSAVEVPVREAELAPAAFARGAFVHSQRITHFI